MKRQALRALLPIALIFGCLMPSAVPLWAQNENETVGFQSNHIFESGQFGENIDVLNGALSLTIPIGPRFQLNSRLGYQLGLSYSSRVWDGSNYGSERILAPVEVLPYNESPMGIGFSTHLGRIFTDSRFISDCTAVDYYSCWNRSFKWVGPDGGQHEFYLDDAIRNPSFLPQGVIESDRFADPFGNQLRFSRKVTRGAKGEVVGEAAGLAVSAVTDLEKEGTGGLSGTDAPQNRPTVITTREAAERPIMTTKEAEKKPNN
jgi:hypothetical protein